MRIFSVAALRGLREAPMPNTQELLALHYQLLGGDREATAKLIALLLHPLVEHLTRQCVGRFRRRVDEQIVWDGVVDALLDYGVRPSQFDASRGKPLDRFLQLAAWRNVLNTLRSEHSRKAREKEVGRARAKTVAPDPTAGNVLEREASARQRQEQASMLALLTDPVDRRFWELRLQGARSIAEFAQVLGITHLPPDEQSRQVKRTRDRIGALMRRRGFKP